MSQSVVYIYTYTPLGVPTDVDIFDDYKETAHVWINDRGSRKMLSALLESVRVEATVVIANAETMVDTLVELREVFKVFKAYSVCLISLSGDILTGEFDFGKRLSGDTECLFYTWSNTLAEDF